MAHVLDLSAVAGPPQREAADDTGSRTAVRLLGCAIAMLIVSFLVVTRSSSALVEHGTSSTTEFRSGVLTLSDDDGGRTMFDLPALVPGRTETRCIQVRYSGDVPGAAVTLRGRGGGALAGALDVAIDIGSSGTFDDCGPFRPDRELYAGTLARFVDDHSPKDPGIDAFVAAPGNARTFRFRFTLAEERAVQGATATFDVLWTAAPD